MSRREKKIIERWVLRLSEHGDEIEFACISGVTRWPVIQFLEGHSEPLIFLWRLDDNGRRYKEIIVPNSTLESFISFAQNEIKAAQVTSTQGYDNVLKLLHSLHSLGNRYKYKAKKYNEGFIINFDVHTIICFAFQHISSNYPGHTVCFGLQSISASYPDHEGLPKSGLHFESLDSMIDFVHKARFCRCQEIHFCKEYDARLAGHATLHSTLFAETRALLSGNRALFANTRAWWNKKGALFADTKAMLRGKRPLFANTRTALHWFTPRLLKEKRYCTLHPHDPPQENTPQSESTAHEKTT